MICLLCWKENRKHRTRARHRWTNSKFRDVANDKTRRDRKQKTENRKTLYCWLRENLCYRPKKSLCKYILLDVTMANGFPVFCYKQYTEMCTFLLTVQNQAGPALPFNTILGLIVYKCLLSYLCQSLQDSAIREMNAKSRIYTIFARACNFSKFPQILHRFGLRHVMGCHCVNTSY